MLALTLTNHGPALRHDWPTPTPTPGHALIRVRVAGICATDLQLLAGYKGGYCGVLGHEFAGEVVAAPGAEQWIDQRVVGEINIGCGQCDLCSRGLSKHCRVRRTLGIHSWDGAFAEFVLLPLENLHAIPDSVPDEVAVFVEPLAASLQILEQVQIAPSSRVVVLGDGRLGLLVAQVLATTACQLTVIGRNPAKLEVVARRGVRTLLASDDQALSQIAASGADVVVEVTGSPTGFALARRLLRPAGVLVLKSTFAGNLADFDASSLVVDEITLLGSRCGPFAPALRLLADGCIDTASLIHARYPLADTVTGLEHAARKGVLKVLIVP